MTADSTTLAGAARQRALETAHRAANLAGAPERV